MNDIYLNFRTFHRLRIYTAVVVLFFALLYLLGLEKPALGGFAAVAVIGAVFCNRIRLGTMPACCDLCAARGTLKAEYGAGFSNARLVLDCPQCGRVVNRAGRGAPPEPGVESDRA
ncbi:hypothetical protein [Desulfogranum mediterraneum]|uniref:hypothetical protein n=1 Tax=Desulfogranum mediterraneum TaxID=160661 RepID=UPI000402FDE8|nr:hypothetical protein [Desulfogranum mediterraneum]